MHSHKVLDRIGGPTLYKLYAIFLNACREEELSMIMNWTYRKHIAERQSYAGMTAVCLSDGLTTAAGANSFGVMLGQRPAASIDNRRIRQ